MLGHPVDHAEESTRTADALAERIPRLVATATAGDDDAVRVTVAGGGTLTRLELDDRVHGLAGPELARLILDAVDTARAGLLSQLADAVAGTVGADSPTGRAVLAAAGADAAGTPLVPAAEPVMPAPPFPTFDSRPTLPHQAPGGGYESGRDSRAR